MKWRSWAVFGLIGLSVACADSGTAPEKPLPSLNHDPILFVHGYTGAGSNWGPMMQSFRGDGWTDPELHTITYSSSISNEEVAAQIRAKVEEILAATGASRVDIVAHSMGSLSSRFYARFLNGHEKVDAWVSLGGPNHGTTLAEQCQTLPCTEMRPGSPFLQRLNEGDETPGAVRYATWRSRCDQVILPTESVVLEGATNVEMECVGHTDLIFHGEVYPQVRDWVKGSR